MFHLILQYDKLIFMKKTESFINTLNSFADELSKKTPDQISVEYSMMELTEHLTFVSEIFNKLRIELDGDGMEVAAGAAVFSCSLTRLYPNIKKIYALEITPGIVKWLQPKIIEHTNMQGRVIPILGDFNNIKLPDNFLDFVVGYNSFHHSNDLKRTLTEVSRVLKPGGKLIFFDRTAPSRMSKAQENWLLDRDYPREYKIQHGIDPNKPYTRRIHGEHEPRLYDWNIAIANAGLQLNTITTFTQRTLKRFIKVLISFVPFFVRAWFGRFQYLTGSLKFLLYYICSPLAGYGKFKFFTLHTKLKTPAMAAMMKHVIFTASKKPTAR